MVNFVHALVACLVLGQVADAAAVQSSQQTTRPSSFVSNENLTTEIPFIAIIIDDIGYQARLGEAAVHLPGPYALAMMPFAPHSKRLALLASSTKKNVILHLPMEAHTKNHLLGQGALLARMSKHEIHSTLKAALASLPQAIGINNHMGSLLTSRRDSMDALMTAIAEHEKLFFVDSKTTQRSTARLAAASKGVPAVERHVFLDNEPIRSHIRQQLVRLVARAKDKGHALAIGHPYPATLATLKKWQPSTFGVKLISLSEYVGKLQSKSPAATP